MSTLPTVSLAPLSGVSTGRLFLPTGVGTVTMNVLHSASACRSVENASCFAAPQLLARRLERRVVAALELGDAVRLDVEADGRVVLAELDGERQPDVPEADDADASVFDASASVRLSR